MSVSISFVDLLIAEELAPYNSIQLLHPDMDGLVNKCLEQLGFDIRQPIEYVPSRHRAMSGKISVDFQAVGEMNRDKKYNHLRDAIQRTVCAGYTDASLAREMSLLMGEKNTYKNDHDQWEDGSRAKKTDFRYFTDEELLAHGYTTGEEDEGVGSSDYIEASWEEDLRAIKQLKELRDEIRKGV